ncbi:MAG: hypothetical protein AB1758_18050, partial [Candidatus Eremiobacterota bacterium]
RRLGWQLRSNLPGELVADQPFGLRASVVDRRGEPVTGRLEVKAGHPATRRGDQVLAGAHGREFAIPFTPGPGVWDVTLRFTSDSGDVLVRKSRVSAR